MDNGTEIAQIRRVVGVGEAVYAAATARAEVVRALAAPELRAPDKIVMQGEAVVALMPVSSGMTLAEVTRATGPLSAGACVWVGTRAARALARLHRAGMAHGAVDADSIVIEDGSAVLLDPGTGVASASPADDVAALGGLLRAAVRAVDGEVMRAWTDPMAADDPAARPTAAMIARALPGAAQERPVALPGPSVASHMRDSAAGISLSAQPAGGRGAGKPTSSGARGRAAAPARAVAPGRRSLAARLSTTPRRLTLGVAGVAFVLLLLAGVLAATVLTRDGDAQATAAGELSATSSAPDVSASASPSASTETGAPRTEEGFTTTPSGDPEQVQTSGPGDPGVAAAQLTTQRFGALAASDAEALIATTAAGSPARERAEEQAISLTGGGLAYEGLAVTVGEVQVLSSAPDSALVSVAYSTSQYVVAVDGEQTTVPPAEESVQLALVAQDGGWRVSDVSQE
ncbi:hypothetical protein RN607_05975 [Demequina capsici]|uniref:Protein kinase domain-containing protein n=1 Tax=Demequina capsici TaxID=3075620 RepID=A0AA96F7R9_9MICO|nr:MULTISPECIES: hypothetical protein [unclassified Demequina]WNM25656.1 hypothetical protein RN606_05770 [Demequina sp. OYTSA14]WNM28551.1 hypothetical protein RN607_05975 [Demequina sp. PMTSA13]